MFRFAAWILAACSIPLLAQVDCQCDVAHPETAKARQCSLCVEIDKYPADMPVIFLKDINPRKANRWLALPRAHASGRHNLEDLSPEQRNALWSAAVDKAKSIWGDRWAVAMNGHRVRTQCHMHVHIGRLLEGVETDHFVVVDSPAHIPLPGDFGLWIHPVLDGPDKGKLHVHLGEQVTETVLLR